MAFSETFRDLRRRRRIPMRLFEERASVNRSYIYGIEKEDLLPSREKLEAVAQVFVAVAAEQGAADPEEDARILFRERDRTLFVERLEFDEAFAASILPVRELDPDQQADLVAPLRDSLELFKLLDPQERRGIALLIREVVTTVTPLETGERARVASALAASVIEVLVRFKAGELSDEEIDWGAALQRLLASPG
jgi:transcriptional regulator with XRE-family HTH domain